MSKHTPGPWAWTDFDGCQLSIHGPGTLVAVAYEYDDSKGSGYANARLIAAAPDLIQWLKRIVELEDDHDASGGEWHTEYLGVIRQARAAIAKAEGETK